MLRRDFRLYDRTLPLVMARAGTLFHFDLDAGDPLTLVDGPIGEDSAKGEITHEDAIRMWISGQADYLTEQVKGVPWPENADVQMLETGGGWYRITAPWLAEEVRVRGEDEARAKRQEIEDKGDDKGVGFEDLGGGWYGITAPWLDEAHKVQGRDEADALYRRVIADGAPDGWVFMTPEEKEAARLLEEQKIRDEEGLAEARRLAEEEAERGRLADEAVIAEHQRQLDEAAASAAPKPDPLPDQGAADQVDDTVEAQPETSEGSSDITADREAGSVDGNSTGTPEQIAASAESLEQDALSQANGEDGGAERGAGEGQADQETASDTAPDFATEATGGGWHEITGPGIVEPIRVQGIPKRDAKLAELRAARA
jgi:hypothetical protein